MRSNINLDLQRQIAGRVRSSESRIFQVFALLGVSHKAIAETLDKSAPTITQWSKGNTTTTLAIRRIPLVMSAIARRFSDSSS